MKSFIGSAAALLLTTMLLAGCSTYNRDWQHAADSTTPPGSVEGAWIGDWKSEANSHHGELKCIMTHATNSVYRARFRATYGKMLRYSYAATLQMQPHDIGYEFDGEANLGKLAGGRYYYEGRATATNIVSSYKSKYDHGIFELHRPRTP
jgi:predicted small secreted protein